MRGCSEDRAEKRRSLSHDSEPLDDHRGDVILLRFVGGERAGGLIDAARDFTRRLRAVHPGTFENSLRAKLFTVGRGGLGGPIGKQDEHLVRIQGQLAGWEYAVCEQAEG